MKAIIIEDEELTAERLLKLVSKHDSIMVLETLYSVKAAKKWLAENPLPDLIFLDIQLGDGTGFNILESIDTFPHIIFTTAFDQYAIDAFKYNSIDYLLKPIKEKDLKRALDKLDRVNSSNDISNLLSHIQQQTQQEFKEKFLVKVGLKYHSYLTSDIAYFYSDEGETYLKLKDGGSSIVDYTLDALEKQLDPAQFFRVNRHMLLCSSQISSIDSYFNNRLTLDIEPSFKEAIIVSRERVKSFKKWLGE